MPHTARRSAVLGALVVLVAASPGRADTPALGDVTAAVGFGSDTPAPAIRGCTGTLGVIPSATVTTFPPSAELQHVAIARSTCAGSLPAGTWYSGQPNYIDIGLWRSGSQVSNTRCVGRDECTVTFPTGSAVDYVLADFHWSLAWGTWSVQEPAGCVPDGDAKAIRCGVLTSVPI